MLLLRCALLVATSVVAFVACTPKKEPLEGPRYSFSPQDAVRACTRNEDCVVLPLLKNCASCCFYGAVARGEAERAYAAAVQACTESGAGNTQCEEGCAQNAQPTCFEGTCVALHGSGDAQACNLPNVDAGTPGDVGRPPSCGAIAVQTGFEDGLDPAWASTRPSAFEIDRSAPLAGGASLKITYRQNDAFFTVAQPDVCAIRIAFTIRTRLREAGPVIARIDAGNGNLFYVRMGGCVVEILEQAQTSKAVTLGGQGVLWPMTDDTPTRVSVSIDLRTKTLTSVAGPVSAPLPTPKTTTLRGEPSGIRAIDIGAAPGFQQTAVGTAWLDDLVID